MNDKTIYIAYILDTTELGSQLLRYAFEHPTIEYYAETEDQQKLKEYFQKYHYSAELPMIVEPAEIIDYMAFREDS